MPRRSVLVAVLFSGSAPLFATGCACDRPLFPRLNCLFGCRPSYGVPQSLAPSHAPPMAVAPQFAPAPAYAAAPGCAGCDSQAVAGHYAPPSAGFAPPGALTGLPTTPDLPPGAIPIGPPAGGPMSGPAMGEPLSALPGKGMGGGYASTGAPTLLPQPTAMPIR